MLPALAANSNKNFNYVNYYINNSNARSREEKPKDNFNVSLTYPNFLGVVLKL